MPLHLWESSSWIYFLAAEIRKGEHGETSSLINEVEPFLLVNSHFTHLLLVHSCFSWCVSFFFLLCFAGLFSLLYLLLFHNQLESCVLICIFKAAIIWQKLTANYLDNELIKRKKSLYSQYNAVKNKQLLPQALRRANGDYSLFTDIL